MKKIKSKIPEEKKLHISYLQSGGLIANYHCSSQCRHCLYSSSPKRDKEYIQKETAANLFKKIKSLGCYSLHIGGGEPFLNTKGLKAVLKAAQEENMQIEYVETNSSWYKNHDSACHVLEDLQESGLSRVLVSISPFHNEYIPFYKVKGVIAACRDTGVSVFPWIYDFYNDIDSFPDDQTNPLSQYIETFGSHYLKKVFQKYWIHPGGRALTSFTDLYGKKNAEHIIEDTTPCIELANTSHFHFDLYENYIPGLCSGTQIHSEDMGHPLPENRYPFLHVLYNKGINGLYQIAAEEFGFVPKEKYVSKCHLCLDIRRFLVLEKEREINEFGPKGFYNEILTL